MTEQTSYAYGYARMPRIIRKGYKNLTKLQKLLYIYLRDLAGEDGTCYRSLRTLQEETGFSIGYLSENIPILHNEGLIHAEMKSSSQTHWQVWHISIVDIWEKNAAFLQSEKCSSDEQLTEQSVHQMNSSVHGMNSSPESVHAVNESVHAVTLNKNHTKNQLLTENHDREEREVAHATARSQSSSQNDLSEDTEKREAVKPSQKEGVHVQNQTHSGNLGNSSQPHLDTNEHSRPLDASLTSQPEHRKEDTNRNTEPPHPRKPRSNPTIPKRPKQQGIVLMDEIPGDAIPEKAIAIMDRWDRVHKKPAPRTIKTIQAAQLLMVYDPSEDELRDCEKWLYTTDRPGKPWYRSHGVHLPDIAEKIGSWQSLQNAPPPKPEKEPSNEHKAASFYSNGAIFERNKAKTEARIAEALAWDEARRAREVTS